ncbi:tetratricopeptide repeat protein, partial [Lutimonas sp.]|uniref:tetratricopeptide repeat protein n=1 Tax=Lutimonas sp. TaxID=1872403 RepID=UPI003D9B6677
MNFNSFVKECHQKGVFKKLSLYIVFSWVLIQVVSVIWEPMGLSKNSITYSLIFLLIGFPTYIFYVWNVHFKTTYSSKTGTDKGTKKKKYSKYHFNFQTYYFVSLGMISFIVGSLVVFVYINKFNSTQEVVKAGHPQLEDKIAVLDFGNNTGRAEFDMVGTMAADWILHGITQNQIAQVISSETFEEYKRIHKASLLPVEGNAVLKEYFNPKKIISGNYFFQKDELIFQGSVIDGKNNDVLFSFEAISCDAENPLDCIELLKQKVMGFLATESNDELNLQETPPNYEAYRKVLEAKARIADNEVYIGLINQALALDSTYFEANYLRAEYYYNREDYARADSLLKRIKPTSHTNTRQKNYLNILRAMLDGNNRLAYRYTKKEYDYAPFDLHKNLSNMVMTQEFVRKPDEILSIYSEINTENIDIENCKYCQYRMYILGMAYLDQKKYQEVIDLLENIIKISDYHTLKKVLLAAHIKLKNYAQAAELTSEFEHTISSDSYLELCLYSGKTLLIEKQDSLAGMYFDQIVSKADPGSQKEFIADANYFMENHTTSILLFEQLALEYPLDIGYKSKLAVSYYKINNLDKATESIKAVEGLRSNFQFGSVDYALGQYYISVNDIVKGRKHLLASVASGHWYNNNTYQNDPHFKAIN